MKNLFAILTIIVAFLSCSDKIVEWRFATELQNVRDLMQEQPDSALKVLISFDLNEKADIAEMHEYQILVAEALYKNDYQQTNDAAVIAAAAYYDSIFEIYPENKNLAFETARAHYYKAVGETEKDDIVAACEDYLEAADIMEDNFCENDLISQKAKIMALTYNRLADLFSSQLMTKPAIDCYKRSIHFCRIEPTSKYGISKSLLFIGKQYDIMMKHDSASLYYRMALDELPDNNNIAYRDLISLIVLNNYYMSKSSVESSIDSLRLIAAHSATESELMTRFLTLGNMFYCEKQYDSAIVYLDKIYKNSENLDSKIVAADILNKICYETCEKKHADEYAQFLSRHTMKEYTNKATVSKLENFYSNYKAKRLEEYHKKKNILYIFSAFLIASLIIVTISYSNRKRNKKLSDTVKKQDNIVRNLKTKIEESQNEARKSELELITLRYVETKKNDLKQKLGSLNITEDFEAMKHNLEASDICKSLRLRFENGKIQTKNIGDHRHLAMTKNEINELMATADRCLPMFTTMLSESLGINKSNQPYCILLMLNFSTAEIAVLMNSSYSAVAKRMDSIRKNLQTEMCIADFLNGYCSDIYKTCHCN